MSGEIVSTKKKKGKALKESFDFIKSFISPFSFNSEFKITLKMPDIEFIQ